jgi:hypothetical protein
MYTKLLNQNDVKTTDFDPGRTRTCNLLIRSQAPYPLGHGTCRRTTLISDKYYFTNRSNPFYLAQAQAH